MAKNTGKNYNTTLIALWETKNGNAMSMKIDDRSFDQLQDAFQKVEMGGKIIIKKLKDETREKFKNPETAPTHFLEYISAADVEAYEAENPRQRNPL